MIAEIAFVVLPLLALLIWFREDLKAAFRGREKVVKELAAESATSLEAVPRASLTE